MNKYIPSLFIGAASILAVGCTTSTATYGPVPVTTYTTTYAGYDNGNNYAPFYSGYRNGYEPTNVYWQNYRDNRLSWGGYNNYRNVGYYGGSWY